MDSRSFLDDVVAAIASHQDHLVASGDLVRQRERRAAAEVEHIALGLLRARVHGTVLESLAAEVAAGRLDPYAAAARIVAASV